MSVDFDWLEKQICKRPLKDDERQVLEEAIEIIFAPPDMPIIHQGAEGNALYLLRSGSVNITQKTGSGEVTLASRDISKVFGEMSLLSGEPVSAKVTADEQCVVYKIPREHFRRLMQEHCELAMNLLAFIVRDMGEVIRRLDSRQARVC